MVSAKASEARLASAGHAVSSHFMRLYFGDQEDTVALTGNHVTQKLLRAATPVISRRIDQRHAERHACSHSLFFDSFRMFSLSQMPRALTDRADNSSVWKFYGPPRGLGCLASGRENPRAPLHSKQCTDGRQ